MLPHLSLNQQHLYLRELIPLFYLPGKAGGDDYGRRVGALEDTQRLIRLRTFVCQYYYVRHFRHDDNVGVGSFV